MLTLRVPPANRYVLVRLVRLLGAISDNAATTRMPASNLATVFAPSMLRHADPMRSLNALKDSIAVVARLIAERGEIFGDHAARPPPMLFAKSFNTIEAVNVQRILAAQEQQGKALTHTQKLAGTAAQTKIDEKAAAAVAATAESTTATAAAPRQKQPDDDDNNNNWHIN